MNISKTIKAQFPKLSIFVGQESIVCHYYIQNVKDGIHIRVHKINKERVTNSSQFISAKVTKIVRKSQPQFREKQRGSGKMMVSYKKTYTS